MADKLAELKKEPGMKLDLGKIRYELMPPEALKQISEILTFGAQKYAARNWEAGISYGRVFGALMRHLWSWWSGIDNDEETGKSHLAHAGCCLFFLLAYDARGMKEFDDRPLHTPEYKAVEGNWRGIEPGSFPKLVNPSYTIKQLKEMLPSFVIDNNKKPVDDQDRTPNCS